MSYLSQVTAIQQLEVPSVRMLFWAPIVIICLLKCLFVFLLHVFVYHEIRQMTLISYILFLYHTIMEGPSKGQDPNAPKLLMILTSSSNDKQ